jgi:hypothetical protein
MALPLVMMLFGDAVNALPALPALPAQRWSPCLVFRTCNVSLVTGKVNPMAYSVLDARDNIVFVRRVYGYVN